MLTILALGTVGFWVVTAIVLLLLLGCIRRDAGWAAAMVVAVYLVLLALLGAKELFVAVSHASIGDILLSLVCYFGCGILWSVVKLGIEVKKAVREYDRLRAQYKDQVVHCGLTGTWREYYASMVGYGYSRRYVLPIQASDHVEDLTRWVVWWPISLVVFLLGDVISEVANWVVRSIRCLYQDIVNLIMGVQRIEQLQKGYKEDHSENS